MESPDGKAIVVAGAHRSGTSALTRVLNLLGAYIPAKVMPPVPGNNERGFWEPIELVSINIRLLKAVQLDWDSVEPLPVERLNAAATVDARRQVQGFLRREFKDTPLFVLKDPRICRLLPLWIEELEAFGARPGVVHCLRNPLDVAASLMERDGFAPGRGLLIWLRHVLESEQHSRKQDRVFVEYQSLMQDWATCARTIGEALNIIWPADPDHSKTEIDSFLTEALYHHRHSIEEIALNKDVADLVKRSYQALRALCSDAHDPTALDVLTAVRNDLTEADLLYAPSLAADAVTIRALGESLSERQAQHEAASRQAEELSRQVEELTRQAEALSRQVEEHTSSIERLEAELSDKTAHLSSLRDEVQRVEHDNRRLKEQLQSAQANLTDATAAIGELESQLSLAESALSERGKTLSDAQKAAHRAQQTARRLEDQLAQTERALAQTEKALARAERDADALEEKLVTANAAISLQETALARTEARARAYEDHLATLRDELWHLTRSRVGEGIDAPSDDPVQALLNGLADAHQVIESIAATLGQPSPQEPPPAEAAAQQETALLTRLAALQMVAQRFHQQQETTIDALGKRLAQQEDALQAAGDQLDALSQAYRESTTDYIEEMRAAAFKAAQRSKDAAKGTPPPQQRGRQPATQARRQRETPAGRHPSAATRGEETRAAPYAVLARVKPSRWGYLLRRLYEAAVSLLRARLFSPAYYRRTYGAAFLARISPVVHYVCVGSFKGFNPHPLFDVGYYLANNPDVLEAGIHPLRHYLRFGAREGRDPHPLFSTRHYLETNPDVAEAGVNPLQHFIRFGAAEARNPHPLFDTGFYVAHHPDLRAREDNPLVHFLEHGMQEGASPHLLFDTAYYRASYPDVARAEVNPLIHFIHFGARENRSPHLLFDTAYYRQNALLHHLDPPNPVLHFLNQPIDRLANPHPLFDCQFYLQTNPDIAKEGLNPLLHFLRYGAWESRDPHPLFDLDYYAREVAAWLAPDDNPLIHYLRIGASLAVRPSESFDPWAFLENTPGRGIPLGKALIQHVLDGEAQRLETAAPRLLPAHLYRGGARWKTFPGRIPLKPNTRNILIVAHLVGDYLFGGERSLLDILQALKANAYNVFVAVPRTKPQYIKALRAASTEVAVLHYGWWRNAGDIDETAVSDFMAYMTQRDIELVHANTIVIREPLVAARRLVIPALVHVREIITGDTDLVDMIGLPGERIVEQVLDSVDYVIANSEKTAAVFNKPGRTFVVPNCVDVDVLDLPNDVDPDDIRIGLISSNLLKKGIEDFAQLAKACYGLIPNLSFLLIGPETEHTKALRRRQAQGNLPPTLVFGGYEDQPRAAIERINIIANLSRFKESFGRTVIEGMAARRPALVYDNGNPPALIDHGKTGFVIPYTDWKAAIPYLQQLCQAPDLIQQMGTSGRRFAVEHFSTERFAATLRGVYADVFAKQARPRRRAAQPDASGKRRVLPARAAPRPKTTVEDPLRIGYFSWHFPVPSETFVLNELRDLVQLGYDVRVFCRQSPYPDFTPDFPLEWERVDGPDALAQRLIATKRDFVHAHFTYPTVTDMLWPACEQAGIQFSFIAHAQDIFKYENDKKNRIGEIVASEACRRVLVPGRFHRDYLTERGVPPDKIVINPQGIDPDLYRHNGSPPIDRGYRRTGRVCALHRFVEKKGLDDLIRAGKLLEPDGIQIDLYGYGPEEARLRALVAQEAITNVAFCGPVRGRGEMIEVLGRYDLFACPSVRAEDGDMDGIPTILLEAMTLGLPVLTTPTSSIPDLVKDGITGLMCQPHDPVSIVRAIRTFYSLPPSRVQTMIDHARATVDQHFNTTRLTRRLRRLWRNEPVDLIIVSWNNLPQLREVIRRIYHYTTMPFHLIICDNHSDDAVVRFLDALWGRHDNVTLIHKGYNSYVGPGTNTALEHGTAKYAIYVCGKEGFALNYGWEQPMIDYMDEHDAVGLAGTLGYSPSYLRGRDYPNKLPLFPRFRNQDFAKQHPERVFRHVQGGLFILRRAMFEAIGGFSEAVPHEHTDVEFSYYVESCGWALGAIDTTLALYSKTRPDITSRVDERVRAIHPPSLEALPLLDRIAEERTCFCNLCGWNGPAFDGPAGRETCPRCGSGPPQRTLYRYLAESTLTYRRLQALYVNPHLSIEAVWKTSFQGRLMAYDDVQHEIETRGQIKNATSGMDVILLDDALGYGPPDQVLLHEVARLLKPAGTLLVRNAYDMGTETGKGRETLTFDDLVAILRRGGFDIVSETLYASAVVRYDWLKLLTARQRPAQRAP